MAALKLQVRTKAGWLTLFAIAAGEWADQDLHDLEHTVAELDDFARPMRSTAFRLLDGRRPIRAWSPDTLWTTCGPGSYRLPEGG